MTISIQNIIPVIHATIHGHTNEGIVNHVSIDSRSLLNAEGTLFFALKGSRNNGHHYIPQLLEQGVRFFVVSEMPQDTKNATFFVVSNTLEALQKLAAYYRTLFSFPVIGITGSNGKTIIKEWLNFLLSPDYNIVRSPKSYNSQVGVPLSILGMNEMHNFGIFEAGISTVNEMDKLEEIIRPSIGILSNIGSAHDEGFENTSQKALEKWKLFKHSEVVIFKKDKTFENLLTLNTQEKFTWSFEKNDNASVWVTTHESSVGTELTFNHQNNNVSVIIPFTDKASIENAIHCVMVLLYFKYPVDTIQKRVAALYPVEMRLKVKNGVNNTSLIDDSYSSDYQSLKIALDFLEHQKLHTNKTIILSDIYQSGLPVTDLYHRVSQLIIANKINRVFTIGEVITSYKHLFPNAIGFNSTNDFLNQMEHLHFQNETILIKGARDFQFEKIVTALEEKTHETVLEINLNALSNNLNYFKSKLKPQTKMMVMVKAFGYGNGGFEIAKLLEHHKVDYLGVAFADEGIELKTSGIQLPIIVMNPESTAFEAMIQYKLEPEIYSIRGLQSFIKILESKGIYHYPIHIKFDTGMHRLGFEQNNMLELLTILKNTNCVKIASILSHLACSDDRNETEFTLHQIQLFENLSTQLITTLQINPIRHILNSSGISNFPEAQYNMVRLGVGLYGISSNEEEQKYLENVGTLKSIISQIRTIEAGESVGYNRRFKASFKTKIATIPIGYADGISRHWGYERGYVTINGKKAPIVGSICMDMLMVNCTNIECKEGQEVVIFGENPSIKYMAKELQTISYEIMTSISKRVKRVFYRE